MKLFRLALFVFTSSLILHPSSIIAGQIANVDYIHKYIASKNGVTIPIKESNPFRVANVKYLLCAIDKANELSAASTSTSYCTHALSTTQAVDTIAVSDASTRLFNCNAGGYYKASGATACSDCGPGYYCPTDGNTRVACTNGMLGCTGNNHASDVALPAELYNRKLTGEEVGTWIPATDLSQWELVDFNSASGANQCGLGVGCDEWRDALNTIPPAAGCVGTIGPGTYLFVSRSAGNPNYPEWEDDLGRPYLSDIQMMLLNKPVGYRIARNCNLANDLFLDTNNAIFTTWNVQALDYLIDSCSVAGCTRPSNVGGLSGIPDTGVYIFKMK